MTRFLTLFSLAIVFASSANAQFKPPRSAFPISELAEAKEKAIKREKPLAFIMYSPK